jgi:hypothetical protein
MRDARTDGETAGLLDPAAPRARRFTCNTSTAVKVVGLLILSAVALVAVRLVQEKGLRPTSQILHTLALCGKPGHNLTVMGRFRDTTTA